MAAYVSQSTIVTADSPSSFSYSALTPTSSNPSVQMNSRSPTDLYEPLDTPEYDDRCNQNDYQSQLNPSTSTDDYILSEIFSDYSSASNQEQAYLTNQINTTSREQKYDDVNALKMLAEPKAKYRERYESEIDPRKNRAHRFIRTEDDNQKYEYPTVGVKLPKHII